MMPQSNTAHTKAQSEPKASGVARTHRRIHWVANDAVGSGRNNTLARLHFDNAGSPSVLPHCQKDNVVTHRD